MQAQQKKEAKNSNPRTSKPAQLQSIQIIHSNRFWMSQVESSPHLGSRERDASPNPSSQLPSSPSPTQPFLTAVEGTDSRGHSASELIEEQHRSRGMSDDSWDAQQEWSCAQPPPFLSHPQDLATASCRRDLCTAYALNDLCTSPEFAEWLLRRGEGSTKQRAARHTCPWTPLILLISVLAASALTLLAATALLPSSAAHLVHAPACNVPQPAPLPSVLSHSSQPLSSDSSSAAFCAPHSLLDKLLLLPETATAGTAPHAITQPPADHPQLSALHAAALLSAQKAAVPPAPSRLPLALSIACAICFVIVLAFFLLRAKAHTSREACAAAVCMNEVQAPDQQEGTAQVDSVSQPTDRQEGTAQVDSKSQSDQQKGEEDTPQEEVMQLLLTDHVATDTGFLFSPSAPRPPLPLSASPPALPLSSPPAGSLPFDTEVSPATASLLLFDLSSPSRLPPACVLPCSPQLIQHGLSQPLHRTYSSLQCDHCSWLSSLPPTLLPDFSCLSTSSTSMLSSASSTSPPFSPLDHDAHLSSSASNQTAIKQSGITNSQTTQNTGHQPNKSTTPSRFPCLRYAHPSVAIYAEPAAPPSLPRSHSSAQMRTPSSQPAPFFSPKTSATATAASGAP